MSFSAFRNPLRAAVRRAAQPSRFQLRSSFNRRFSDTPPPPPPAAKSSNNTLYYGLGGIVIGAVGYYIYTSNAASNAVKSGVQSAKVQVNFVPSKEDYIKVRGVVAFRDF
jgi:cytochrome c peroxidase